MGLLSGALAASVRGFPTDGKSAVSSLITNLTGKPSTNQLTDTSKLASNTPIPIDAYRVGTVGSNGQPKVVPNDTTGELDYQFDARKIGDYVPDNSQLAHLSIEIDPTIANGTNGANAGSSNSAVINSKETIINQYTRFFLQSVSEGSTERYQIVETFNSHYVFFFGKRPSIYTYSGILLNDEYHRWANDFMFFYENFFRGTKAVELGAQAVMSVDGRVAIGFILGVQMQQFSEVHQGMPFSFTMVITDHIPISYSDDIVSLIQAKQQQLNDRKAIIAAELSKLNSNVNSERALFARRATTGYPASKDAPTGAKNTDPVPTLASKKPFGAT